MTSVARRGLFWRVYLTLLASLILVSMMGAVVAHLLMGPPPGLAMRMHMRGAPGLHALWVLLSLATVVALAAYPVVARITRRLEALRRSVEAWGAGDLTRRAAVEGRDEIASVAVTFNTAADRVDALLAAHRGLLAHASHELRSPLARLAMAVELYAQNGDPSLPTVIRTEIAELDMLVGEILLSSRLDHGEGYGERESVDLLALAAEECARSGAALLPIAAEAGPFEIDGSARLLRRMIRNLLENALKHGAAPIEVLLARSPKPDISIISIVVRDYGPGIPEHLRERVFEPFFRPAGSGEDVGGWGLGLALVRQIADRHGGGAYVETVSGLTSFTVELPAA